MHVGRTSLNSGSVRLSPKSSSIKCETRYLHGRQQAEHYYIARTCLVRQEEGPPHAIVPTGELKRQLEAQLDKHIPTRQPREAPVRMHSQ